jgi:VanZ family protein
MKKRTLRIILTSVLLIYAFAMVIGAAIPNPSAVPGFSSHSSYFHFFGFMVLSIIAFKTFELYNIGRKSRFPLAAAAILLFLILLTEFLQLFVATRHFSVMDMLIDVCGCVIGWAVYRWIFYRQ